MVIIIKSKCKHELIQPKWPYLLEIREYAGKVVKSIALNIITNIKKSKTV